eukprot:m51a1_g9545 hypothetical protein (608) ;mRNA; r:853695-857563
MGVRGLSAWAQKCGAGERVDLVEEARAARARLGGERPVLVVDGDALAYHLYLTRAVDWAAGGSYARLAAAAASFVSSLALVGFSTSVVLDGATPAIKLREAWDDICSRGSTGVMLPRLPVLAKTVLAEAMTRAGASVRFSLEEADRDAAHLCRTDPRCYAVLSNDSDFLVFDVPAYIPLDSMNLVVLACLLGNDYTKEHVNTIASMNHCGKTPSDVRQWIKCRDADLERALADPVAAAHMIIGKRYNTTTIGKRMVDVVARALRQYAFPATPTQRLLSIEEADRQWPESRRHFLELQTAGRLPLMAAAGSVSGGFLCLSGVEDPSQPGAMARNEEKACAMLNRWVSMKRDEHIGGHQRRPARTSDCDNLTEAERWRSGLVREISRKVSEIQNPALGEAKIRDLNDHINSKIRLLHAWERRIVELGGPNYSRGARTYDKEGKEVPGSRGYHYFGEARNLPGVKELLEAPDAAPTTAKPKSERRRIDADYFGFRDEEDGTLLELEAAAEKRMIDAAVEQWKAQRAEQMKVLGKVVEDDENLDMADAAEALEQQFVSHVPLPSKEEMEETLLQKRKEEMMSRYISEELREELSSAAKDVSVVTGRAPSSL